MKIRLSPRVALLVIAAMFLLPLALAWLMYSGTIEFKPASTRNLGQLVEPPLPLSWENARLDSPGSQEPAVAVFGEHWTVLYTLAAPCAEACIEQVTGLRQVHRAAGRQQQRIRLALLLPDQASPELKKGLMDIYGNFHLISDPSGALSARLAQVSLPGTPAGAAGTVYLVDPLANIMMVYAPGSDPNNLKQDLKRLLTWSKLDEQS